MNTEVNEKKFLRDRVAVRILKDEDCRDYVKAIICAALKMKEEEIVSLELLDPNVSANAYIKNGVTDAIFNANENAFFVNIEVNYSKGKNTEAKNFAYLCHTFLKDQKTDNKYQEKKIYLLNINNYDVHGLNKFIYYASMRDEESNKIRSDYIRIIDINVDFLSNIDYTDIREEENSLESLLYIFVKKSNEELDKMYLGNKIMEKVREKLNSLTQEFDDVLYYDPDELRRLDAFDSGKTEGIEEGLEQGEKRKQLEIAKSLLEAGCEIDFVKKHTQLSEKEIKTLCKTEE